MSNLNDAVKSMMEIDGAMGVQLWTTPQECC